MHLEKEELRNLISENMKNHHNLFEGLIKLSQRKIFYDGDNFINTIRNFSWEENIIDIGELMTLLERPIFVIDIQGNIANQYDTKDYSGEPIFVFYNGNSYDAFIKDEKIFGTEILCQLARLEKEPKTVTPNTEKYVKIQQTANQALYSGEYEKAITHYEQLIELNSTNISNLFYRHNCACAYHLLGKHKKNSAYFETAEKLFKEAIADTKNLNIRVEYANFLRAVERYSEAITILNNVCTSDGHISSGLSYSLGEAPALPEALAEKIRNEGTVNINHPQFFAHYLKIQCLLAETPIQPESITTSLHDFTQYVAQFKRDPAETMEPIDEWFLAHAHELYEKKGVSSAHFSSESTQIDSSQGRMDANEILATSIEEANTNQIQSYQPLLFSLKNNMHTLFRQGHRFVVDKSVTGKLKISTKLSQENPLPSTFKESLRESISLYPEKNEVKPKVLYDDRGDMCLIKGSQSFISQVNQELKEITEEYEQETGEQGCRMS